MGACLICGGPTSGDALCIHHMVRQAVKAGAYHPVSPFEAFGVRTDAEDGVPTGVPRLPDGPLRWGADPLLPPLETRGRGLRKRGHRAEPDPWLWAFAWMLYVLAGLCLGAFVWIWTMLAFGLVFLVILPILIALYLMLGTTDARVRALTALVAVFDGVGDSVREEAVRVRVARGAKSDGGAK